MAGGTLLPSADGQSSRATSVTANPAQVECEVESKDVQIHSGNVGCQPTGARSNTAAEVCLIPRSCSDVTRDHSTTSTLASGRHLVSARRHTHSMKSSNVACVACTYLSNEDSASDIHKYRVSQERRRRDLHSRQSITHGYQGETKE
jgi:hypothetical protein